MADVNIRLVVKKDRLYNFSDDDGDDNVLVNTLKEREGISELYTSSLDKPKGYNVIVEKSKAEEIFNIDLATQKLTVPDFLSEVIETAYVPTEPEYFYASPPNPIDTDVAFLTLEDIASYYSCGSELTGQDIRVAMPDSGFFPHPFFTGRFNINRYAVAEKANADEDDDGHGTGESANILVIAPNCTFLGVKRAHAAESLEYCLSLKPKVLVCSWGWDIDNSSFESLQMTRPSLYDEAIEVRDLINEAIQSGIIVVFAAGNGAKAFPASMPEVISVGGVTYDKTSTIFQPCDTSSNFTSTLYPGRKVPDISGICGNRDGNGHIVLPVPKGSARDGKRFKSKDIGWGIFSGTSAAAPQVAGVIALILSIFPNASQDVVKDILRRSATIIPCNDNLPEQLLVNAQEACKLAHSYKNNIVKKEKKTLKKNKLKEKMTFLRRKSK